MLYKYLYKTPKQFSNILLESDGEYLTGLHFTSLSSSNKQDLPKVLKDTCTWLDEYFKGHIPSFTPKYKINNLTPFRKEVIDIMNKIEYGKTTTYKSIANTIIENHNINKMSSQAVGGAVGSNPICIIIPCHRVIGSNNSLTGYSGGINNKIELLKLEGIDTSKYSIPKKGNKL